MADSLKMLPEEKPWYADGLKFKCTECGQCCTGAPGFIWVTDAEIEKMAEYLEMANHDFRARYVKRVARGQSLVEKPDSYDCAFLDGKKCSIYEVRPKQCRTFPWWPDSLKSEQDWLETGSYCEGITQKDAPLIPYEKIKEQLAIQMGKK